MMEVTINSHTCFMCRLKLRFISKQSLEDRQGYAVQTHYRDCPNSAGNCTALSLAYHNVLKQIGLLCGDSFQYLSTSISPLNESGVHIMPDVHNLAWQAL